MARGPSSWASRHFTRRPSLGEGGHGSTILDDRCSFRESAMRCLLVFSLVVIIMPSVASAQDMTSLTRPGVVALMRHALAPGSGDPSELVRWGRLPLQGVLILWALWYTRSLDNGD